METSSCGKVCCSQLSSIRCAYKLHTIFFPRLYIVSVCAHVAKEPVGIMLLVDKEVSSIHQVFLSGSYLVAKVDTIVRIAMAIESVTTKVRMG